MDNEIVVDAQAAEVSIAVLEDKRLIEFNRAAKDFSFAVGDIYLGKVHKIMPGLNAAFVNVGSDKDAFIHYLDLGPHFATVNRFTQELLDGGNPVLSEMAIEKGVGKDGKIAEHLTVGQEIMVQIVKEPISTKGPRLTSEISIAGRNMVLIPFADKISVSQKIGSREERNRLRKLMQSVKPHNYGLIIRTAAEGKMVAELDGELKLLQKRFEDAVRQIARNASPKLLLGELDRSVSVIRDIFNQNFHAIHVNDEATFHEISDYVSRISPEQKGIVHLYNDERPIFDAFNITRQLKSSLGRIVSVKNGAYLVIEHTEALHVIDVNSGNRFKLEDGQEANALEVNLLAAAEIARQLRLRDMGGIVVVDFIDMAKAANRQALYEKMCEVMSADRARHNILPLSKFGLMQITRQRVRPVIHVETEEVCPTCMGTGKSKSSILFVEDLEDKVDYLTNQCHMKKLTLQVHPYIFAYITKGLLSLRLRWKLRYGFGLRVVPIQDFSFLQYRFLDAGRNEVALDANEPGEEG